VQRIERRAVIGAPPEVLFAYLADLDNLAEWQSGIVSARRTSDDELGVGSTALVARELMGQRMEAPLTVTSYDPPRRLAIAGEVGGVKAVATLDLAPTSEGRATDLAFSMEIRGSMMTAFLEPMIASAAAGDIDASLAQLRARFVERSD
jgi:uncharacterized protein YndB with AHSA1/START domain